jgi:hypothetical protein
MSERDTWDELVEAGQIIPAENPELDLDALDPLELGFSASERLEQLRANER